MNSNIKRDPNIEIPIRERSLVIIKTSIYFVDMAVNFAIEDNAVCTWTMGR